MDQHGAWWDSPEGEVHTTVMQYVAGVEQAQQDVFDRFLKLSALYDPEEYGWRHGSPARGASPFAGARGRSQVCENVIASNVDSVTAIIATTDVRPRFTTDEADWATQRQARKLGLYSEALAKKLKVHAHAVRGFHDGALKGSGFVKVYTNHWDEICLERVMVDDLVVDEGECRSGYPRQMHQRMLVSREVLIAEYPEQAEEIRRAHHGGSAGDWRLWADYRPINRDELVVIESWRLPVGVKGQEGYLPGRHTITIDGCDLYDEEWHKKRFPFARFVWQERDTGFYGIGLAERIAGHQRTLNKLNWQIDAQLDRLARPIQWVPLSDANIAVRSINELGTIGVYKTKPPVSVTPTAVSQETYMRRAEVKDGAFEESGQSRMAAQARKPAGIESGAALREYRDQTTQRFAHQERNFEAFVLEIIWLIIDAAKDLGDAAPSITAQRSNWRRRKIEWSEVDMGEVELQLQAASNLSRTPAGRAQLVLEMAQGGLISADVARRLMLQTSTLDPDSELSMYTAALENIDFMIEEIRDGEDIVPGPYAHLEMGVWRMQQAYLLDEIAQAPEEILEAERDWLVMAGWILTRRKAGVANDQTNMPADPAQAQLAAGGPPQLGDGGAALTGAGVTPMAMAGM